MANACDTVGDGDVCQARAKRERLFTDACDTRGNGEFCIRFAVCILYKCLTILGIKVTVYGFIARVACINRDACQSGATGEWTQPDACDAVRDGDACQTGAIRERIVTDACDTVGDGDACQADANRERRVANDCDAVANGDTCQAEASRERPVANACDTVADGNTCQFGAIIERIVTDACDGQAVIHTNEKMIAGKSVDAGDGIAFAVGIKSIAQALRGYNLATSGAYIVDIVVY